MKPFYQEVQIVSGTWEDIVMRKADPAVTAILGKTNPRLCAETL
jgi:hypothetical protein